MLDNLYWMLDSAVWTIEVTREKNSKFSKVGDLFDNLVTTIDSSFQTIGVLREQKFQSSLDAETFFQV